jgi:hypothetical protein
MQRSKHLSRTRQIILAVAFVCVSQVNVSAQTPAEYLAMTKSQQDAVINRFVTKVTTNPTWTKDSNGQPIPKDSYEQGRAMVNLSRVLFLPDASNPSKVPEGYDQVRNAILAKKNDPGPILSILAEYIEEYYKSLTKDDISSYSDTDQVRYFRKAYAERWAKIHAEWEKSSAENAKAHAEFEASYKKFQETANALRTATDDVLVTLQVKKLALEAGAGPASIAKIEALMKDFSFEPVFTGYLKSFLSPTDASGRPKPADKIGADKRRANLIAEVAKQIDSEEVARRIYRAMKASSPVDVQGVAAGYIRDELMRREAAAPSR